MNSLRPGIEAGEVTAGLAARGLAAPESGELQQLYGWHDGVVAVGEGRVDELRIWPGYFFLTLTEALAHYDANLPLEGWEPGWFPLLTDGGGSYYVIELDGQPSSGAIRLFRMDEIDHPRVFGSVGDLFATMSEAIDRGLCFVDDEGHFELDDRAWFALAAARNPQFDWWQNDE